MREKRQDTRDKGNSGTWDKVKGERLKQKKRPESLPFWILALRALPPFGWFRRRRPVIRVVHLGGVPTLHGAESYRTKARADTAETGLVRVPLDLDAAFSTPYFYCTVCLKLGLAEISCH